MENNGQFVQSIADILGIDSSEVLDKLDELGIEEMAQIIDCLDTNDSDKIKDIMNGESIHPLISDNNKPEETPTSTENTSETTPAAPSNSTENDVKESQELEEDYHFRFGDEVRICDNCDEDDDDEDYQIGTVEVVTGPNNTVGVKIDGKLTMVTKKSIKPVSESVFAPPDDMIARMQALAGLSVTPTAKPKAVIQIDKVQTTPVANQPQSQSLKILSNTDIGMTDEDINIQEINSAFSKIATLLPNVRQKDVKAIRISLSDLSMKLNESKKDVPKTKVSESAKPRSFLQSLHDDVDENSMKYEYKKFVAEQKKKK